MSLTFRISAALNDLPPILKLCQDASTSESDPTGSNAALCFRVKEDRICLALAASDLGTGEGEEIGGWVKSYQREQWVGRERVAVAR